MASAATLFHPTGGIASVLKLPQKPGWCTVRRCSSTTTTLSRSVKRSHRSRLRTVSASVEDESDSSPVTAVQEVAKGIRETWEKTDDKLTIAALGVSTLVALWASTGLVAALDKLPLIPDALELVGIFSSGWFVYRYLLFKPDRELLLGKIDDFKRQVFGKDVF